MTRLPPSRLRQALAAVGYVLDCPAWMRSVTPRSVAAETCTTLKSGTTTRRPGPCWSPTQDEAPASPARAVPSSWPVSVSLRTTTASAGHRPLTLASNGESGGLSPEVGDAHASCLTTNGTPRHLPLSAPNQHMRPASKHPHGLAADDQVGRAPGRLEQAVKRRLLPSGRCAGGRWSCLVCGRPGEKRTRRWNSCALPL